MEYLTVRAALPETVLFDTLDGSRQLFLFGPKPEIVVLVVRNFYIVGPTNIPIRNFRFAIAVPGSPAANRRVERLGLFRAPA